MRRKSALVTFILVWAITAVLAIIAGTAHAAQPHRPGAVIYGAIPPFFGGPPFRALNSHLPRLKDLGVDIIWISPIMDTDDASAINYQVRDYFKVRSDFGTEEEFAAVVRNAHKLGMRVILDIVPNHTSNKHRFFIQAQSQGRSGPYYNFYQRDSAGNPVHYFDWDYLPNLNYNNHEVVNHIGQAFVHWIEKFKVDGYRVDVAWGVRERAPRFWPMLNSKLDQRFGDVIMLAEAGAQDPYYIENGFDLAYDWTSELGVWAWKRAWENPENTGILLHNAMIHSKTDPRRIARFLNNNDTAERFITRYGVATQRVAAVLQFTVPGVPILYMGDEVGAEFSPYEDPPPIKWNDRFGLTPLYRHLANLRELSPALHSGAFSSMRSLNSNQAYAFARWHPQGESWAVPVMNFGTSAGEFKFVWPKELPASSRSQVLCDVLNVRVVEVLRGPNSQVLVKLAAKSAMILAKREACAGVRR